MTQNSESNTKDWEAQIKEVHGDFKGTIFLVGAGAVSFQWKAMEAACTATTQSSLINSREFSALIAYQMSYLHKVLEIKKTRKEELPDNIRRPYEERNRIYQSYLTKIAEQTRIYSTTGEVNLPSHPKAQELLKDDDVIFITLNYDDLLEKTFKKPVLHLHGVMSEPSGLILPTETATEGYREGIQRAYAGQIHLALIWLLQRATKVVLWGCSLDPNDAEFQVLIAESNSASGSNREWYSINPCEVPDRRIEYLIGKAPLRLWQGKKCKCSECAVPCLSKFCSWIRNIAFGNFSGTVKKDENPGSKTS